MTRVLVLLMLAPAVGLVWGDEPLPLSEGFLQVGEETLLAPVAFGDSESFWENHALVIGTVENVRMEFDAKQGIAREHIAIRVKKRVPARFRGKEPLLTKVVERHVPVRDLPATPPPPLFRAGDELMLMVSAGERKFASYAMMPGGQEMWVIRPGQASLVRRTARLCQALAMDDARKRLARMEALLSEHPPEQVRLVLQRRLASTIQELEAHVQKARSLIEKAGAAAPRQPTVAVPAAAEAAKEATMSGIVTATSGRVVVLQEEEFFSVNKETRYFRETGLDPQEATAEILAKGTAVLAVGSKDIDGEFVAARVYALLGNVLRDDTSGLRRQK